MMREEIFDLARSGLCTGCGTCCGMCPEKALSMEMLSSGANVPRRAKEACSDCGLCARVCPVLSCGRENGISDALMGNVKACYKGFASDTSLRRAASSGGAVSAALKFLFREGLIDGAILVKGKDIDPMGGEAFMARSESDVMRAMGSRYVPVSLNGLLSEVMSSEGRFAVVGLPCHMQGIREAEHNTPLLKEKIAYHLGISCSHVIDRYGVGFILGKMEVSPGEVSSVKYRGDGWPGGIKVVLKDGREKFMPNQGSFWSEIFGGYFFTPLYCSLCYDQMNDLADISFADAWIPEVMKKDKEGTSLVIARNEKGEELLGRAMSGGYLGLSAITEKEAALSQLWPLLSKKRNIKARMSLLKLFGKKIPPALEKNIGRSRNCGWMDTAAAAFIHMDISASRRKPLRRLLAVMPLGVLKMYRRCLKRILLHGSSKVIREEYGN